MDYWTDSTVFNFTIFRGIYEDPCDAHEGKNGVAFGSTHCGDAWGSSTLAMATTWYSGSTLSQSDIVFNSNRTWNVYSTAWTSSPGDFQRVAIHELGHCIGLGHEDSGIPTIMTSYVGNTTVPQQDDIDGVAILYGGAVTQYSLSVSKAGTGSGTVTSSPSGINCGTTCSASFDSGTDVTLTATPASGSTFTGWSGACDGAGTSCTLVMDAAKSVTATFSTAIPLYFPHIATTDFWQTEIAVINTGNQTVTGTLKAFRNAGGSPIETQSVTLGPHGRRQIVVADAFTYDTEIGYIIFDTTSSAVQGYTKFYKGGYRVAIPAVREVNTSDIYVTHIASSSEWWTGISLVNTTAARKTLTFRFSDGRTKTVTLAANEHRAFAVKDLFNYQPQPLIESAVISNASGIIGLELFATYTGLQMEGILLTDRKARKLYYPYVMNNDAWWTGIVAYNPSSSRADITVACYDADGNDLAAPTHSISGLEKYIGNPDGLGLPLQTAWFRVESTLDLSGFELIGSRTLDRLASYAGNGGTGSKTGVFPKIEKDGYGEYIWVNTEAGEASVQVTGYRDDGTTAFNQTITIGGHAQFVGEVTPTSSATYMAYTSNRNMVGLQLNYSDDGTMLDGLPALAGAN